MALSELERSVTDAIARRGDELVALAASPGRRSTRPRATSATRPGKRPSCSGCSPTRQADAGAEIDLFEPDRGRAGRPAAGARGARLRRPAAADRDATAAPGAAAALVFNGHIDVVSAEPIGAWTSPPFEPEVRDGRLYGRGACDMKGGVAAMAFAAEALAQLGVRLAGDLLVATNTDEESSGAGGAALVAHGLRADAGIVTEPTGLPRLDRVPRLRVRRDPRAGPGRARRGPPARAGVEGGAVNAIEKAAVVIEAIAALRERWSATPELDAPGAVAAVDRADDGRRRRLAGDLPAVVRADDRGHVPRRAGRRARLGVARPRRGRTSGSREYAPATTGWPRNPPQIRVVDERRDADGARRRRADRRDDARGDGRHRPPGALGGLDSWYDGATLTTLARDPVDRLRPARLRPRRRERRPHDRRVRARRRPGRLRAGAGGRGDALLRPGLSALALDALGDLDALLADVDEVAAQDPVVGLAARVDADRLADLALAAGLVDVAVDRQRRLVAPR